MSEQRTCKLVPITSDEQFASTISTLPSDSLQVLYFHAPWATPCAQMSTVLETLASTYPETNPPQIAFLAIDAEELPDISEDHDVSAVPYVVLKRDQQIVDTISGSDAAKVRSAVEKHYPSPHGANGTAHLPPAQKVTRPENQPVPQVSSATNGTASTTKNMSTYVPSTNGNAPSANGSTNPQSNEPQDLNTRLDQLTKAAPVMLFMKGTPSAPECGFSRRLVSILRQNSVRYGFFNILADDDVRQGLKEFADWPTFPQLWLNGELVGGLDIVREELENDPDLFAEYVVDVNKTKPQNGTTSQAPQPTVS